jgi:DNA-binding NtrC family response regulator
MAAIFDTAAPNAKPQGLRILVVEDHEDSRELMAEILRRTGRHSIALAANTNEGLRYLRATAYDLVVTDVRFSDGSGVEMLDQAEDEGLLATTSVAVWSAMDGLRHEVRARGAQFIAKPVDADRVFALIERVRSPATPCLRSRERRRAQRTRRDAR